jgi:hypothetical protein
MIRDAVLHLKSEQPLLVDLEALPDPSDNLIICSNLRMMNGNRPVFVDEVASTFVFPMEFVRFIEVPPKAMAGFDRMGRPEAGRPVVPAYTDSRSELVVEEEAEIDEDFLKRVRDV